jgi:2-polyprenyl-6-hydroxyphenyl methylase/3-demethylubiquinone-9 3-methyltransferase
VSAVDSRGFAAERRFAFGENWRRFSARLDERGIQRAEASLRRLLGEESLAGARLLDVGSGSGLFSLAARRLGARVHSFDLDADSVACTRELRARYAAEDGQWTVEQGSILDRGFVAQLGTFDVVYAWGVLHHTGEMWRAIEHALQLVAPGGRLVLAIYNDQGRASARWKAVKRLYNRLPRGSRWLLLAPAFVRLWGPTLLADSMRGRPLATWRRHGAERGMSPWRDVVDWVGGWPFEVARPEEVFHFCRQRGFALELLSTRGSGLGCNELVLRAPAAGRGGAA